MNRRWGKRAMTRIKTQWEKALGLATVPPHQRCTIISTLYLLGRLMDGEVGGSKNHVLNAYLHNIYIYHHHHYAAVVSRGWAKASACRIQITLSCAVLCHIVSRQYLSMSSLSTAWLVSLVVFSCHMVSKWWHARSIGRLWGGWYALLRTISFFSQCWLYLWPLSSPWPRC